MYRIAHALGRAVLWLLTSPERWNEWFEARARKCTWPDCDCEIEEDW